METERKIYNDSKQIFPDYQFSFVSNNATKSFPSLISQTEIDEEKIFSLALKYVTQSSKSKAKRKAVDLRGITGEIVFKSMIDSLLQSNASFCRLDETIDRGNKKLEMVRHNEFAGYTYKELTYNMDSNKYQWVTKREYDAIVLAKQADSSYFPIVFEVKTGKDIDHGLNSAIRPGRIEKKLEHLSDFFGNSFGYGVITSKNFITDDSPLQAHFIQSGGILASLPFDSHELSSYAETLYNRLSLAII